jgi:hypothetical protein
VKHLILVFLLLLLPACTDTDIIVSNECERVKLACQQCEALEARTGQPCEDCPAMIAEACHEDQPDCDRRGKGHCKEGNPHG